MIDWVQLRSLMEIEETRLKITRFEWMNEWSHSYLGKRKTIRLCEKVIVCLGTSLSLAMPWSYIFRDLHDIKINTRLCSCLDKLVNSNAAYIFIPARRELFRRSVYNKFLFYATELSSLHAFHSCETQLRAIASWMYATFSNTRV